VTRATREDADRSSLLLSLIHLLAHGKWNDPHGMRVAVPMYYASTVIPVYISV
jgi:hypothetical protein